MKPRTLILRTAGVNCDAETAYAFERAGAITELIHINRLIEDPAILSQFQIMAVPGGFSYGDDIAAGRIFSSQLRHHLGDALRAFVDAGKPIIGICNGFQVLVQTELLPGRGIGQPGKQSSSLALNDCGHFVDRWVHLVPRSTKCIWTQGLGAIELPIAHGEGRFVPADASVRKALWDQDQVALVYATAEGLPAQGAAPANPNGSVDDIAGVCDDTGLVFGLMPHPERHVDPIQHPAWTSRAAGASEGHGLRVFTNAVRHVGG